MDLENFRGLGLWSLKPLTPERGSSTGHGYREGHVYTDGPVVKQPISSKLHIRSTLRISLLSINCTKIGVANTGKIPFKSIEN